MPKQLKTSSLQPLIAALKAARLTYAWSQRDLAEKVGIPQSHISRIEKGEVDLQTSNLIEIARALGLEVVVVPKSLLPVLRSMQTPADPDIDPLFARLEKLATREPWRSQSKALRILGETVRELRRMPLAPQQHQGIRKAVDDLFELLRRITLPSSPKTLSRQSLQEIDQRVRRLRALRNEIVHGAHAPSTLEPAYRLSEDGGDE